MREAVDEAVREGRATVDEIVLMIHELGENASRAAVGRYVKAGRKSMETYRHAQEFAKVMVGKLEAEPNGDVARLLPEMVRTITFQYLAAAGESETAPKAMDIMLLGKALDHLARTDKAGVERTLKLRKEVTAQAAEKAVSAARKGGLSASAADAIRREILGIAA